MRITERPDIQLNREELLAAAADWHFGSEVFPEFQERYRALLPFLETQIDVAWEPEELTAYCAVTLGAGIDRLQERCSDSGDMSGAYMLECLGCVLLQKAYDIVDELLRENMGLYVQRYVFPGDGELPLSDNGRILRRIREAGDAREAGRSSGSGRSGKSTGEERNPYSPAVSCNESYMLTPQKSVVFVAVLGADRTDRHLCDACPSLTCPNRKTGRKLPDLS